VAKVWQEATLGRGRWCDIGKRPKLGREDGRMLARGQGWEEMEVRSWQEAKVGKGRW
jgi:hypothetical protein